MQSKPAEITALWTGEEGDFRFTGQGFELFYQVQRDTRLETAYQKFIELGSDFEKMVLNFGTAQGEHEREKVPF